MKRTAITILFLICLLSVGCRDDNAAIIPSDGEQSFSSVETEGTISKADVIRIFSNEEGNKDYTVTDCVIAKDLAYGLTGIVQYTDQEGNPCNLAFVKDTWSHPVGLDAENSSVIAGDSILTYVGNGTVSLSLKNRKSGAVYDYTVDYACKGVNTNFKVSSVERK